MCRRNKRSPNVKDKRISYSLWPVSWNQRCGSVGQEALSVVSEDQPIFEPPYTAAPAMHMKSEMTSPCGFGQASKQSPEPAESEWVGSAAQNPGKRGEHINGTRWVMVRAAEKGGPRVPGQSDCPSVSTRWDFPGFETICLQFTIVSFVRLSKPWRRGSRAAGDDGNKLL